MQQETLDYHLKLAWQSVSNKYNQIAAAYGITQAIGYMLINIEDEGAAVTKLAALHGVKPTSLSRMLKNMEDLDLITRETDAGDKRSNIVKLTSSGIEKKKVAKQVVKKFNEYLNDHFTAEERGLLSGLHKKLNTLAAAYTVDEYEQEHK